jgi:Ala-tRNA(Pro) deacylase
MDVTEEIRKFLDSMGIKYRIMEHEPTPTSEIAAKVRGTSLEQGAKALVFRSKGKFLMCVLPGNRKVNMKKVRRIIGQESLSLATADEVLKVTHSIVGGVSPFGNLFGIPVYVDKSLLKNEEVVFNAGKQTVSIMIKAEDYMNAVKPVIWEFAE